MADTAQIKEHMDVISSDKKTVGKVDHLEGSDKIKLTKQSSPDGQHHHFIPVSWVDHIDQHVHLNKSGADVTAHWQHGQTMTDCLAVEGAIIGIGANRASGRKSAIRTHRG